MPVRTCRTEEDLQIPRMNDFEQDQNYWLEKLNSFGGDFRRAEMVKAFISSTEYRKRFGTP